MDSFNWNNIKSYNNSQNNAFEELVCQLAREEEVSNKKSFIRVGAPDGGVEAYCTLENGDEYGWQAKYFHNMGDSQWNQLEKSFKNSFEKHPQLKKYYICIPLDRQDPRKEKEKWFMDKWNDYIKKWTDYASGYQRGIEFEFWGSHEILFRLSQEKHVGRRRFWFNIPEFNDEWFNDRLNKSIDNLGSRYTPELNFELEISKIFDGLTRDEGFKRQFDDVYKEVLKNADKAINYLKEKDLQDLKEQLSAQISELSSYCNKISFDELEIIDFDLFNNKITDIENIIEDCTSFYYKLKDEKKEEKKTDTYYSESHKYNSEIHSLRKLLNSLYGFQEFNKSETAKLANTPVMLLKGEAGIGKSHLLADIAKKIVSSGNAAILLLGQHFSNDDNPWTQIFKNQLRLDMNEDEFLGALDAKAQSNGSRILVIIDAINEGRGRFFWKDYIKGFINSFKKYKWVGLVLSVRNSYEEVVIPKDIITSDIVTRVMHYGFADVEYEASKLFFDSYKIQQPNIPLLHPEFQNPLFLKLFCEGLNKAGLNTIPEGLEGISKIIGFFIESINNRLSEPSKFDYSNKIDLVKSAIYALIPKKLETKLQYVTYEEAKRIISEVVKDHCEKWRHFLDELINEGILAQNIFWVSKDTYETGVYFAYDRFDDHITTAYLVQEYLNKQNPETSFREGQPLFEFVKDEHAFGINKGIIEALSIQLPEIVDMELYEVAPFCKSYYSVIEAFVDSLLWRKADTVKEKVIEYINEEVLRRRGTYEKFWDTILQIASNPKHFFNGYSIHSNLMKQSLANRDSMWTTYISQHFLGSSAVKRLIDWAWSDKDRSYISDESIKLSAITISWFFTSPNRKLRDCATKALVCILQNRIHILIDVLKTFECVNDPYVYERVFAVAYGCALRTNDLEGVKELSLYVHKEIFSKEDVYPHVLLRDYARGIIEYAVNSGIQLNIDLMKVRPPYKSKWYDYIPSNEEIDKYELDYESTDFKKEDWAQNTIIHSMITEYGHGIGGYGDFGRYVFQSAVDSWEKYFDPQELSNIAIKRVFELGYDVRLHGDYDTYSVHSSDRHEHKNERIGKKYQWIAFHELLAKLSDNYPMSEIDYSRNDDEGDPLNVVDLLKSINEELNWEETDDEASENQDVNIEYDNNSLHELLNRTNTKRERKYIEFPYNGPWNPFIRDIDPTILISSTNKGETNFFHNIYQIPEKDLDKWVHDFQNIPSLGSLVFVHKGKTEYILLSSHINWDTKDDEEKKYSERKELFIKTTALLVPIDEIYDYANSEDVYEYSYSRHWEDIYTIYSREYYWHPAYRDHKSEIEKSRESDKELKTTTLQYLWEKGYDSSIEGSISFLMPSEFIVDQLGLKQKKDGFWFNEEGKLICYDLSLEGYGTSLIVEKESLMKILKNNNLAIIWDIFIKKKANKINHEWRTVATLEDDKINIINIYGDETWPLRDF